MHIQMIESGIEIRQFMHSAEIKREIPFFPSVLHA